MSRPETHVGGFDARRDMPVRMTAPNDRALLFRYSDAGPDGTWHRLAAGESLVVSKRVAEVRGEGLTAQEPPQAFLLQQVRP